MATKAMDVLFDASLEYLVFNSGMTIIVPVLILNCLCFFRKGGIIEIEKRVKNEFLWARFLKNTRL